MLVEHRPTHFN
jgi:hypothetical protein